MIGGLMLAFSENQWEKNPLKVMTRKLDTDSVLIEVFDVFITFNRNYKLSYCHLKLS